LLFSASGAPAAVAGSGRQTPKKPPGASPCPERPLANLGDPAKADQGLGRIIDPSPEGVDDLEPSSMIDF
jgi:hypothetical protein